MPLRSFVIRAAAVLLAVSALAACGGIGDVAAPTGNATVGSGSGGPSIQGAPRASVAVGQTYTFQPDVSGVSGGALAFTVRNLPSWLTLNTSTGRLSGSPSDADIGTYSGIIIDASNGTATSSLGPFAITVSAHGTGTASLSWMPPTQNSDGSALTDLAGFVVLYGQSEAELTEMITINNPSVSSYVVERLTSGTWYFAVQAANTNGARSELSGIASKTIS